MLNGLKSNQLKYEYFCQITKNYIIEQYISYSFWDDLTKIPSPLSILTSHILTPHLYPYILYNLNKQ